MRMKIIKYEARNAVNIGNIDKFCALKIADRQSEEVPLGCNDVVDDFKLINAVHDLFRCSLV